MEELKKIVSDSFELLEEYYEREESKETVVQFKEEFLSNNIFLESLNNIVGGNLDPQNAIKIAIEEFPDVINEDLIIPNAMTILDNAEAIAACAWLLLSYKARISTNESVKQAYESEILYASISDLIGHYKGLGGRV